MCSLKARLCAFFAALPLCFLCPTAMAQSAKKAAPVVNPASNLFIDTPEIVASREHVAQSLSLVSVTSSTASYSRMLTLGWHVSRRRTLSFSVENMKVSSFYVEMEGIDEKPDWYFKALPLTVSLNHNLGKTGWRLSPIIGAGASIYLSKTRTRTDLVDDSFERSMGVGMGAQFTGGLKTRITSGTYMLSQVRYRIINGVGLTTDNNDYEFGMLDFAIGFGIDL